MAIAHDADSNSGFQTTGSFSWNHTVGAALTNSVLIVGGGIDIPTSITSVKYAGATMTQAVLQNLNEWSVIYYLVNPTVGTNAVAVVMVGLPNSIWGASSFSGVDQTTPIDASNKTDSTTANPSTSVTVVTANAFIMDCIFENATTLTAPTTANSKVWSLFDAGGPSAGSGSYKGPVGTGPQSLAWTVASSDWARTIVALRPAAAAATSTPFRMLRGVGT